MPFLTVAGITVLVNATSAEASAPQVQGTSERMFDGTLRTSKRARKFVGVFTLAPMSEADYQTLLAAIPVGTFVTVGGDALPAPITAEVEVTRAAYVKDGLGFMRTPTLAVTEV